MRLKDKPLLFSAAIILSLLGSGIAIIGYAFAGIFYDQAAEFIKTITNITSMQGTSRIYFGLFSLLYAFSLYGVILMAKWKKTGFKFYSIAQICILFLPVVWLGKNAFSVTNTIFTVLFILIYLSFYKRMES